MPKVTADFSETKERGAFSPKHVDAGEYRLVVEKSEIVKVKSGPNQGKDQLIFTFSSPQIRGASYPYYVSLAGKAAWKLRSLLEAAGFPTAGKKLLNFDSDRLNGKEIGGELVTDEWTDNDGTVHFKSVVDSVFSASELEDGDDQTEPLPVSDSAEDNGFGDSTGVATRSDEEGIDLDQL